MWKITKLGNVCKIQSGNSIPVKEKELLYRNVNEGLPYVATKDVGFDGVIDYENGVRIPLNHSSKFRLSKKNSILVCGEGGSAGRKIAFSNKDCHFVNKLFSISTDREMVSKYVYYYTLSNYFQNQFKKSMNGLIGGVSLSKIKGFQITYPPFSEQQRIVAKLDSAFANIDKAILLKQNSIINLNKFFKTELNNFFQVNSTNWKDTALGEYYDVRDGTHDSPKYVAQGIPLVTSKNLKKGKIDLTKIKYIKNEDYLNIKKRSGVSVGDVLMAMIGTIGNPVVVKRDNTFAIKNVALFKIKQNQSSDFLKFYLSSSFVVNKMMKDAKGATQKFVGLGYLRDFPIKIPSYEKQKEISLKIIEIEKNIESLNNKYNLNIQNYISLKKSLLSEFLNKNKAA